MELADSGDLMQAIDKHKDQGKPFDEQQIWSVLIQVTRALY